VFCVQSAANSTEKLQTSGTIGHGFGSILTFHGMSRFLIDLGLK